MFHDSGAMTVINTRHRCRICFAILKAPMHGKTSNYYSVHSNRRPCTVEPLLLPSIAEDCNVMQDKCTSLSNERLRSCSSMSFMDLMERFLRVSVDTANCVEPATGVAQAAGRPIKAFDTTSHSDIICVKCSAVLTKISELHLALQKLATSLREKYLKTLRIVGRPDAKHRRKVVGCGCAPQDVSVSDSSVLARKAHEEQSSPEGINASLDGRAYENASFQGKYDLVCKATDDVPSCDCLQYKGAPELRESLQSPTLVCGVPRLLSGYNTGKLLSQNKNCGQCSRLSKRKGKPRHHIKIGDRRVGPSEANKFRPCCAEVANGEFQETDEIPSGFCTNDETLTDINVPAVTNPDTLTGKQYQSHKVDKATATDKDSRLRDHMFPNEHRENTWSGKSACPSEVKLQHCPCPDRHNHASIRRADNGRQEEDEENDARPMFPKIEAPDDHKYGTGRGTVPSEHTPVNDERRAKANNINRIAATLMGDCNSTDSMDVEEGFLSNARHDQHGIRETCNSCSNLEEFFVDSFSPGPVNKERFFSSCRTGDASAVNSFKADQHFASDRHHKRQREYLDDGSQVDASSNTIGRSRHDRDDVSIALKYRHGQNNAKYFADLKLFPNATFVPDGSAEGVDSCRYSADSPAATEPSCKSSGLNGAKAAGDYGGLEDLSTSSKGFEGADVEHPTSVGSLLQRAPINQLSPGDPRNPSSKLVSGCLVAKVLPQASRSSGAATPAHPQLHSRQLGNFKRYQCGFCGKIVTNIQIHVRRHTNEKPYRCEYCEKRFTNSGDLQIHTRIHTGEKPYRCPICAKSYRTIGNFNSHVKTHDRGERPHRCVLCNETFEQTRDWFSHLRSNHKMSPASPVPANKMT